MKLYWRVKINGKWTWRPAKVSVSMDGRYIVEDYMGDSNES